MATIRKRLKKNGTSSYRVEVRLKGFPPQSSNGHGLIRHSYTQERMNELRSQGFTRGLHLK